MSGSHAIDMRGIVKRFGPVTANAGVDFSVVPGEIHCLLGENGAGKSTLMKILFGLYPKDAGEIRLDGRSVDIKSPAEAIELGVGMVHQHFMLVDRLTVTENLVAGMEPTRRGLIDMKRAKDQVADVGAQYGLAVDPSARIEELSVGEQQRVEILKSLLRDAKVLILDEPTAVLTPQEVDELFHVMLQLKASGKTLIFITHKLRETMAFSDRVTVLRNGANAGTVRTAETGTQELAEMMVGRKVALRVERPPATTGNVVLEADNVSVFDATGRQRLKGVNLQLRAGEIVGIAGVEGNGQLELEEALTGLRPLSAGRVLIDGHELFRGAGTHTGTHTSTHTGTHTSTHTDTHASSHTGTHASTHTDTNTSTDATTTGAGSAGRIGSEATAAVDSGEPVSGDSHDPPGNGGSGGNTGNAEGTKSASSARPRMRSGPRRLRALGGAHIPSDRLRRGLVPLFPLTKNAILAHHWNLPFCRRGILQQHAIRSHTASLLERFRIRAGSPEVQASSLSGGNQQKLVVGRELGFDPRVIVAAQPTRGVDVGAIEQIHQELLQMRAHGKAILLISAELDELLSLSDRIAVIYEGEIVTEGPTEQFTQTQLGLWMAGEAVANEAEAPESAQSEKGHGEHSGV